MTGAFDDAYSAAPAAVVPKPAAPLFIDLPSPAVAPEPEPAALLVVNPVAPAVVPEPTEQHEHAHDDTDPFELHDCVLHTHDGDPDAQWAASVCAISMSNLRADGDDKENEALLLAARPENEALLLAAIDAPLLPENKAPLLAAGDALLLPENESLLLTAGDAPPLPTEESAPPVGNVGALHVSGENMLVLGAGVASLHEVAVVPPKQIVALTGPVLAMLEKAVPVVIGPLLNAKVVKVVRASDDFLDKAQLLLKKSPLLDGYVLPELAAPKVDMPVVIELVLDAEVLLQLDGAVPASMYVKVVSTSDNFFDQAQLSLEELQLYVDFFDQAQLLLKESPLYVGNVLFEFLHAEGVRLLLQVAVDADVLRGDVASDSTLQRAMSVRLEGGAPRTCGAADVPSADATGDSHLQPHESVLPEVAPAVPELVAPEVDMPVVPGLPLDAELLLLGGAVPASRYVEVVHASDDFFDQAQLSFAAVRR